MSATIIDAGAGTPTLALPARGRGQARNDRQSVRAPLCGPGMTVHVGGKCPPSVIPGRAEGASPGPINTGAFDGGAGVPGS